jgi:hypothetical protein
VAIALVNNFEKLVDVNFLWSPQYIESKGHSRLGLDFVWVIQLTCLQLVLNLCSFSVFLSKCNLINAMNCKGKLHIK